MKIAKKILGCYIGILIFPVILLFVFFYKISRNKDNENHAGSMLSPDGGILTSREGRIEFNADSAGIKYLSGERKMKIKKSELKFPQYLAFPIKDGGMQTWCPHCARWHYHGVGAGHRSPHCSKIDGREGLRPNNGYTLNIITKKDAKELIKALNMYLDKGEIPLKGTV